MSLNFHKHPFKNTFVYVADGVTFSAPETIPSESSSALSSLTKSGVSLIVTRAVPHGNETLVDIGVCFNSNPEFTPIAITQWEFAPAVIKLSQILLENIERRLDTDFALLPLHTHSIDEVLKALPSRRGVTANEDVVYIEINETEPGTKEALTSLQYMPFSSKAQLHYALNAAQCEALTIKISSLA
ncbi:hypothetical protein BM525_19055 (plasmid) [Alteromonas mediterranea]|uniref:Uncharacterized protein n=1 Tax=Alteromonas mediterranea TaxID=314275 RepID=A0AAC9NTC8_9ALTE|nr:hypothetical protein [Alteromonas mediterranea]APD91983.1 hypothetical protein BM524_18860 [Alteromonas mediterranea]APD99837.1 hypothetical protein BM525_19055 [Alteromonas mediterranea]